MLHKTMLVLATALALGGAVVSTSAFAHEHGFHHHGWNDYGWDDGYWPGNFYDGSCYEPVRYHTATGWQEREVDVCAD